MIGFGYHNLTDFINDGCINSYAYIVLASLKNPIFFTV